jgi:hypothetical protein
MVWLQTMVGRTQRMDAKLALSVVFFYEDTKELLSYLIKLPPFNSRVTKIKEI